MAALNAQTIAVTGTAPTFAAATSGGDTAPVGDGLSLHVRNGGASAVTVGVVTPGTFEGLAIADASVSVPAGGHGVVPLKHVFRDPVTGRASITYSAVTSVTVAVLQTP